MAPKTLVDGFEFVDEIPHFFPGIGATRSFTKVGAAGKRTEKVEAATAIRTEERAGAISGHGDSLFSESTGGLVGKENLAPGQKRSFPGETEAAAI
jgi:hypothetical protein